MNEAIREAQNEVDKQVAAFNEAASSGDMDKVYELAKTRASAESVLAKAEKAYAKEQAEAEAAKLNCLKDVMKGEIESVFADAGYEGIPSSVHMDVDGVVTFGGTLRKNAEPSGRASILKATEITVTTDEGSDTKTAGEWRESFSDEQKQEFKDTYNGSYSAIAGYMRKQDGVVKVEVGS